MTNRRFIFCGAPLLPVAFHFLARGCEHWHLKAKDRFKFEALAYDLARGCQQKTAVSVFFAFVDFAHLARLNLDSDPETMEPTASSTRDCRELITAIAIQG